MRTPTKMLLFLYVVIFAVTFAGFAHAELTYQTFDHPGAILTSLIAIDQTRVLGGIKTKILGMYDDVSQYHNTHYFIYDGSTFIPISLGCSISSGFKAISGTNVVGTCTSWVDTTGFVLDSSTYKFFYMPSGYIPRGISGTNIVGTYYENNKGHGFLYNGSTYKILDVPGAAQTYATGISGSNIVGYYQDIGGNCHGFLYNGSTYTILKMPGANRTWAYGISGTTIVGRNDAGHGFIAAPAAQFVPVPFPLPK